MATSLSQSSSMQTIAQLSEARKIALGDSAYYAQIVPGVLPFIGPSASLELRRWGADFLAETFACPTLSAEHKEKLSLAVLDTLRQFLDAPSEDTAVVKSMVQIATSIYPHVFKHTIFNPTNGVAWPQMAAIKSNILRRIDSASPGVRICCIKFIQRVVQVQTPGLITDPRRSEQNDLSLALVPQGHALLSPPNLQAEALGLLDRLLNVFQEEKSDPLYVTATINSIGPLVRTRASLTNRILNALLNFNPFKLAIGNLTPQTRIACKSMERTARAFLVNLNKSNPSHPMAGRIQGYLDRLQQMRLEIMEEGSRKRAAPIEPTDGLDSIKRQRLGAEVIERSGGQAYPALPPGPVSLAQLFTLTNNEDMKNFDVQSVPLQQLNRIVVPILARIDAKQLDEALKALKARYLQLTQAPAPQQAVEIARDAVVAGGESTYPTEDAEQLMNHLDNDSSMLTEPPNVSFGRLVIAQPPPLTAEETKEYGKGVVVRVFDMVNTAAQGVSPTSNHNTGLNRLAAGDLDSKAFITILTRLATRTLSGLESQADEVKREGGAGRSNFSVGDIIRDALYMYILNDFRRHIDVAISWLNEEWYNDQVQLRNGDDPVQRYDKWALKLLDGIVPYLDAKDKVLIRFLSEIPRISKDLLQRVKRLAQDPERVGLAINSLHYLALFRPPVREMCIDALEDLWRNYDDAKMPAQKMLQRWRPQILQAPASETPVEPQLPAIAA